MANPAQAMAAAGRKGDTELAHVGVGEMLVPREVIDNDPGVLSAIIKAFQKAGADWRKYQVDEAQEPPQPPGQSPFYSGEAGPPFGSVMPQPGQPNINPQTGAQEFFFHNFINPTTGLQEFGITVENGRSSDPGTQRDSYGMERAKDIYSRGGPTQPSPGTQRDEQEFIGFESVLPTPSPGAGVDPNAGQPSPSPSYDPLSSAPGLGGGPDAAYGPPITNPNFRGEEYPSTMVGRALPDIMGNLPSMTRIIGEFAGKQFDGKPLEGGPPDVFGKDGLGYQEKSEDENPFQQVRQKQLADVVRGFQRPDLLNQPGGLNLSENMTPEQMRAAIATRGVEGNDARFRSQEAIKFFLNSIRRRAIDAQGNVQEIQLLPIERQYLRQVVGLKGDYPNTQGLLEAIAGV